MTDTIESLMEDDLKQISDEVLKQLKKSTNNEDLELLSPIENEKAIELLTKEDIIIYPSFKDQLLTPYAVAKYVSLLQEEAQVTTRVEDDLNNVKFDDSVSWTLCRELTNEIRFIKMVTDEKPQGMSVKYRIDPETDEICYTISSGNWGWDVTKDQLKCIINNSFSEYKSSVKTPAIKQESDLTLTFGDVQVSLTKIR